MRYDVLIVGAGPGGSTTARECASRGLSVLMLDKAEFPRDKPCGGAVTIRCADLLPFDLSPVVERTISRVHLSVYRSKGFAREAPRDLVYLTQRSRLDTFLVDQAIEAGAEIREHMNVRSVEHRDHYVEVRAGNESFQGTTLVAADGANGRTAEMAGINLGLAQGIALEGNVTPSGAFPKQWENTLGLDMGGSPGGYGWIFPKGDHLNIGLAGWKYIGPNLRPNLNGLVRHYGYDPSDVWGLRGHHLPIRNYDSPLADGNVLVLGDAAGLLDPLTGEGIYSAVWSGKAASAHLAEYVAGATKDLRGYQYEVEQELVPELMMSRRFHDLFHLTPRFYIGVERLTSIVWDLTVRVLLGEQTYARAMQNHKVVKTVVDFLSDYIRVTPFLQRRAGMSDPAPPQRFFLSRAQNR